MGISWLIFIYFEDEINIDPVSEAISQLKQINSNTHLLAYWFTALRHEIIKYFMGTQAILNR